MEKQYTYQPVALRFRRWSRKKYAAFISLKQAVTIGNLSANVSERFQIKNGSTHTSVLSSYPNNSEEFQEEECSSDTWLKADIPFQQLSVLLSVQTIQQSAATAYGYTLINNKSGKAERFCQAQSLSAFSFIQKKLYD